MYNWVMNLRNHALLLPLAGLLFLAACSTPASVTPSHVSVISTTVSREDAFLSEKIQDDVKSRMLTDEGIRLHGLMIKERKEYTRIPQIKEYFEVALLFDPGNAEAKKYLEVMEDLRVYLHSENLKSAKRLIALEKPSETEEYRLMKATQNAVYYDPASTEAAELYKKVQPRREAVIKGLLDKTDAALAKARSGKAGEQQAAYIEAFQLALQALAIAPNHQKALSVKTSLRQEISTIVAGRIGEINKTISSGKYREAEKAVESIQDLNKKLENEFDKELAAAQYRLYYSWAEANFKNQQFADAAARARKALGFQRSKEALAIIDKVSSQVSASDKESGFDAGLKKLDDLVARSDIAGSMALIQSLNRLASTPAQQKSIDTKRNKLAEVLPDLYTRGVAAYKSEDLAKAIELLELVVLVDSGFKDAQDYLDKAKSKKKLLDQY